MFGRRLLGAGIRVTRLDADWRALDVEMKLRFWNSNYVGTHYGGSLYSMTDPFYMLMLIENLGREYVVWDKAATIRFKKPGVGKMRAEFRVSEEQINGIRESLKTERKVEPVFMVEVRDEGGVLLRRWRRFCMCGGRRGSERKGGGDVVGAGGPRLCLGVADGEIVGGRGNPPSLGRGRAPQTEDGASGFYMA